MKRTILLLLFGMFLISVAHAVGTITVTDTVRPEIKATFNETVQELRVGDFELRYTADDSVIDLTNSTEDNRTFIFVPKTSLRNGFYTFWVNAKDLIGNPKTFEQNIAVNINKTDIYFKEPITGFSSKPKYNIILGTSRDAMCRWSYFNIPYNLMLANSFSVTGTESAMVTDHTIKDFPVSASGVSPEAFNSDGRETLPYIYVACIDKLGLNVSKKMYTGFDESGPVVSLKEATTPVIKTPPTSKITTDSQYDRIFCSINNNPFSTQSKLDIATYVRSPVHNIIYDPPDTDSNGEYTYTIICENLAGTQAAPITQKIVVDTKDALSINIVLPNAYIQPVTNAILQVKAETNKEAECEAYLDDYEDETILVADAETGTVHTKSISTMKSLTIGEIVIPGTAKNIFLNGTHYLRVWCKSNYAGFEDFAEETKKITIDTSAPSTPTINATACEDDEIDILLKSFDNESGIVGYNYTLTGPNVSLTNKFSATGEITETGLKLSLGGQYRITAFSMNGAGKTSSVSSPHSFTFNPNTTIACMEKDPPYVTYNITNTSFGRTVRLICLDESGCLSLKYNTGTTNCSPTKSGSVIDLTAPDTICYEAIDRAQNVKVGSFNILFTAIGSTCFNTKQDGSETDVDCGGNCPGCNVNQKCKGDADCAERWCVDFICKKPLCTDKIKNGFESDVDCGGKTCPGCAINKSCVLFSDCASNYCKDGKCAPSSCMDGITNGLETDVDCGGTVCLKCSGGKSCSKDSDCTSGSCYYGSCSGKESFEEWALKNGIDPEDKDGDADGDGLTNYEEYQHNTDPKNKDTDGDGYSDKREIDAKTDPLDEFDFPVSKVGRFLLLFIGILILVTGLLMLYYFKADKQTSLNIIIIGGATLLILLFDWMIFTMPSFVHYLLAVLSLGGAGYLIYLHKDELESLFQKPGMILPQQGSPSQQMKKPEDRGPTKEEIDEARRLAEELKREKALREKQRKELFEKFGGEPKDNPEMKNKELARQNKNIQIKSLPKFKKFKKEETQKPIQKRREESAVERLSNLKSKGSLDTLSKLEKSGKGMSDIERLTKKRDAFEKLGSISKSNLNDVFSKLPSIKKEEKKEGMKKETDKEEKKPAESAEKTKTQNKKQKSKSR
ncbi:cell envelope integrity protein TolA [Candidatus Woesearchaeota archaeon]|nr:cell envelope integrity protein TolA [Candidatus Woesearchaeota archaeon]